MIDSHVHFFDPTRPEGLVWPSVGTGLLRSTLPANLLAAAGGKEIEGVIAVETSRRFEDDLWLLELAAREPLIRGVVLNLQPDLPDFEQRFSVAVCSEYFCGIRLRPIADYDLNSPILRKSIARLSDAGCTVEFGAKSSRERSAFVELAGMFPQTDWILDHCGHPDLGAKYLAADWLESMQRISELSNASIKVTNPFGLTSELNTRSIAESCKSLMTEVFRMFGHQRLMFGSNWPVCSLSASYDSVVGILDGCLNNDDQRDAFFFGNARHLYR